MPIIRNRNNIPDRELDYDFNYTVPNFFALTEYCNLQCQYCHVPDFSKEQSQQIDERALLMVEQMVKKAHEEKFALRQTALHGAEPTTLTPDTLQKVVMKLRSITTTPRLSMQTNGLHLTESYFDQMGNLTKKLNIGFSIDLPRFLHNKNRQGTFDKVYKNLATAVERGYTCHVLLGISAEVLSMLPQFKQELLAFINHFPSIRVMFNRIKGEPFEMTKAQRKQWADFLWENHLHDFDRSIWGNLCHTQGNDCQWFEFALNGDTTSCNRQYGRDTAFANWQQEPMADIVQKRRTLFTDHRVSSSCKICEHWDYCKGGCPLDRDKHSEVVGCKVRQTLYAHFKNDGIDPRVVNQKTPQFVYLQPKGGLVSVR